MTGENNLGVFGLGLLGAVFVATQQQDRVFSKLVTLATGFFSLNKNRAAEGLLTQKKIERRLGSHCINYTCLMCVYVAGNN